MKNKTKLQRAASRRKNTRRAITRKDARTWIGTPLPPTYTLMEKERARRKEQSDKQHEFNELMKVGRVREALDMMLKYPNVKMGGKTENGEER